MKYLAIYNSITGDVDSYSFTNDDTSIISKKDCTTVEITESEYDQAKGHKSGAYFDNGLVLKPLKTSKYDKWDYAQKAWVLDTEFQLLNETVEVRNQRDSLLVEMDEIVSNPLRWATFSPELQAQWVQYRLDLLNVPQQSGFPLNVVFPEKPVV